MKISVDENRFCHMLPSLKQEFKSSLWLNFNNQHYKTMPPLIIYQLWWWVFKKYCQKCKINLIWKILEPSVITFVFILNHSTGSFCDLFSGCIFFDTTPWPFVIYLYKRNQINHQSTTNISREGCRLLIFFFFLFTLLVTICSMIPTIFFYMSSNLFAIVSSIRDTNLSVIVIWIN